LLEVFSFYDKHIEIITEKIKRDRSLWPEKGLANKMCLTIVSFFLNIKENEKADALEQKYRSLGWR
jgi:hypothetical protein